METWEMFLGQRRPRWKHISKFPHCATIIIMLIEESKLDFMKGKSKIERRIEMRMFLLFGFWGWRSMLWIQINV